MPSYEDFRLQPQALLLYVSTLGADEAFAHLERMLVDQSWRQAPAEWLSALGNLVSQHGPGHDLSARNLRRAFVDAIVEGPVQLEAHLTLVQLLSITIGAATEDTSRLVSWFVKRANPGDAALAADVLSALLSRGRAPETKIMLPMIEWLVRNGAAELRSQRRGTLLHHLVVALGDCDPDLVVAALRYFSVNDGNLAAHYPGFHRIEDLLIVVERALERGGNTQMVAPLAVKLGEAMTRTVLDVAEGELVYPRTRRAIVAGLLGGALGPSAWRWAFSCPCPRPSEGLAFGTAAAVDAALEGMRAQACPAERSMLSRSTGGSENQAAWGRFITSEFARIYNPADGLTAVERHRLNLCIAQSEATAIGIGEALLGDMRSDSGTLCQKILAEGFSPWHVAAAVAALPALAERRDTGPDAIADDEICEVLIQLVRFAWREPVFGVDMASLLRGITRVELAKLSDDDKVFRDNETLRVDGPAIVAAIRLPISHRERLALAALYCVHELVHVHQGLGSMKAVEALRSTGAEQTLMHVDLGADHAAAVVVSAAFPRWRLEWLKDLQGRSLVAFPASPFNSAAGRARKAQRLVGLRLDYLARETMAIVSETLGEGYAFADFGPAGGSLLVMVSGPPFSVIKVSELPPGDGALLSSAADPGLDSARLAEIDNVLRRALKS